MTEPPTQNKPSERSRYMLLLLASAGLSFVTYQTYHAHVADKKNRRTRNAKSMSKLSASDSFQTSASWRDITPALVSLRKPMIQSYSMDVSRRMKTVSSAPRLDYVDSEAEMPPQPWRRQFLVRHASQPELDLSPTFLQESSYRETVVFLLAFATFRLMPDEKLLILSTFQFGSNRRSYFCGFESKRELDAKSISSIEAEMKALSKMQLELTSKFVDFETCLSMLRKTNQHLSAKLVSSLNRPCYRMVGVDKPTPYYILQYRTALSNTKYCSRFRLHCSDDCASHFVLRFPQHEIATSVTSSQMSMLTDADADAGGDETASRQPQALQQLWQHGLDMSSYLKINSVSDINDTISRGQFKRLVLLSEAYHNRQIVSISNQIASRRKRDKRAVRIILISGPSSSGKTTFASKLGIQLRLLAMKPRVLEVDMFFRDRKDPLHPRDADGQLNFEVIEALKLTEFNLAITRLLAGETIRVPKFDFKTGQRVGYQKEEMQLDENNGVLIIEGIFCLNPRLLCHVKQIDKIAFKIFICPISPFAALDNFHFISEQVIRLIRRISRDHFHRGSEADHVVFKWGQLRSGEDINIFPYVKHADSVFNSALLYELCVLKVYSYPLLQTVSPSSSSYKDAQNLLAFLDMFFPMPDRSVPNDSLLMEFIGTSIFEQD